MIVQSVDVLIALAAIFIAALVGSVKIWTAFKDANGALMITLLGIIFTVFLGCSLFSVSALAYSIYNVVKSNRNPDPLPTPIAPSETPNPASPPLPMCVFQYGEWPCKDTVLLTIPQDNLEEVARRNYHIVGFVEPEIIQAICDANRAMLDRQFIENIPPEDRSRWDHDPCNYLVPGTELVIPILPFDLRATPAP